MLWQQFPMTFTCKQLGVSNPTKNWQLGELTVTYFNLKTPNVNYS